MDNDHMTGAELQTMREACNLTREELATLAHVKARSIKHWEQGRMGVPADVAAMVATMEAHAAMMARLLADTSPDVLVRFSSADDLTHASRPAQPIPLGLYGAIIGKAGAILRAQGKPCRVVWFRAEHYAAWREASSLPDTPDMLAKWATAQIPTQARPFKADQPPAFQ